jgi:hypothetical protein
MTRNKHKDILDLRTLKTWSAAYTGSSPLDNYNSPLDAPTRWWEKLQDTSICILSGEDEVFVDDIAQFADRLKVCVIIHSQERTAKILRYLRLQEFAWTIN